MKTFKELTQEAWKKNMEAADCEEQAPVAPVPDRKYIKGTKEYKDYMATKKGRVGHPTNEEKDDLPFTPDKPKKNPSAKAGKYGLGHSVAKHLAQMAAKRQAEKQKEVKEGKYVPDDVHIDPNEKYAKEKAAAHNAAVEKAKKMVAQRPVKEDMYSSDEKPGKDGRMKPAHRINFANSGTDKTKAEIRKEKEKEKEMSEQITFTMTVEEFEQLDEISKKTLGSYVSKASVDMANRTADATKKKTLAGADYAHNISRGMDAKTADKHMKKDYEDAKPDVNKAVKRMHNINKAVNRLTKEEVELEEGLRSMLMKATGVTAKDVANSTISALNKKAPGTKMHNHPNFSKFKQEVHAHISSAKSAEEAMKRSSDDHVMSLAKKHFTEEAEQVEEKMDLAKAKMGDVIKDFEKSDAPQFAGKSKEKRRQMAVAAKLGAEREAGMREDLEMPSFADFLKEYESKDGKYTHKGSYGSSYQGDSDDEDAPKKPSAPAEKRGRGRPVGSKSGARTAGSSTTKKTDGADYTGYPLHLPNKK